VRRGEGRMRLLLLLTTFALLALRLWLDWLKRHTR
jgi:hypothetical protein